jgi:hypothetical protein
LESHETFGNQYVKMQWINENYDKITNHCSFIHHNWGIDKSKPLFIIFIYFRQVFNGNNKDEKYTIMM